MRTTERELIAAALNAMAVASNDGEAKYPDYHWREPAEPVKHQLQRALDHILCQELKDRGANIFGEFLDPDDDLAHAIMRLVIAYARRQEGLP